MPRQRLYLLLACALLTLAPALALVQPLWAAWLPSSPDAQDRWRLGLNAGLLLYAVLAWRLNQNRLALLAVGLAAAAAWTWSACQGPEGPRLAGDVWLAAVPSGLALSLLPREGALVSERSFGRLALLFLPAGLLWAVASSSPEEMQAWQAWRAWGPNASAQPSHLAHASLLLLVGALAWRLHSKIEAVLVALAGTLIGQTLLAWDLAATAPAPALAAKAWLASQVLQAACLGFGLFMLYWQRVYLDELTGIPNRRALDERLAHLDGAYSLAMIDIDHFKNFNDTYGHDQGDDVLRLVGHHLKTSTGGKAYRYGGEEFCALFPAESSEAAEAAMDRVRADLARIRFSIRLPKNIRKKTGPKDRGSLTQPTQQVQVTVSVGVARPDKKHPGTAQVMKLADEGLYEAKERGRNNVVRMN